MLLGAGATAQTPQYTISTVAGGVALPSAHAAALSTGIGRPAAIAADAAGNVYFASSTLYSVFKMDASGTLTVVAGNGHAGDFGDGGPATAAQLSSPSALALDPAGNLYIADGWSGRVRKVSTDGIIHTIAGTGVGCCWRRLRRWPARPEPRCSTAPSSGRFRMKLAPLCPTRPLRL